ncbi:hypothetical protein [Dysgonomonas sp. ZJ279]|uniref:hypothetical protein n=1 Tax=Dysgonomonas sp. ZJ279 TaxID=2709796 RepID=UPI0013EC2F94|nr:hypothetical protein [Dysgonomonas sp. ZJ279]
MVDILFGYKALMADYLNPADVLFWGIVGGLIGFTITLLVELLLRKKIMVKRCHWSLTILSYVYMFFLPLYAGFCFTQWFAFHNCETQLVENMPKYLGDTKTLFNTYLNDEIQEVVAQKYPEFAASMNGVSVASLAKGLGMNENDLRAKAVEYIESNPDEADFLQEKARAYVEQKIAPFIIIDKDLSERLARVRIEDLLVDGALNIIVEDQIRQFFGGLKLQAILLLLVGILIPVTEIVIANRLEKKRLSPPPFPPHITA